jgi:ATP-binding protein involved in chromosome partitioning
VRIAIPMTDDCLEQHFGHCQRFALIDVNPESKLILSTTEIAAPEHQPGILPPWLKEHDVTHVIAGGIGAHARSLCDELSIEVIAGAPSDEPGMLALRYLEGTLKTTDHSCDHNHHH